MQLPEKVNASWIATLGDRQLVQAEALLHGEFVDQQNTERLRMGARYTMLRGPQSLVNAWLRWLLVNNEALSRGVNVRRKAARRSS